MSTPIVQFNPTDLIRVHISPRRRFAEVIVTDFEDPDHKASTGYLDAEDRALVAARLHEVAAELEALNAEAAKDAEPERDWWVTGTEWLSPQIRLKCRKTGVHGYVEDYSRDEWKRASNAPNVPWQWTDASRVLTALPKEDAA